MELHITAKHELYKQCLNDIESGKEIFCCSSFYANLLHTESVQKMKNLEFLNKCPQFFPELYALRCNTSKYNFGSWFSNRDKRIIALKKCIELTK